VPWALAATAASRHLDLLHGLEMEKFRLEAKQLFGGEADVEVQLQRAVLVVSAPALPRARVRTAVAVPCASPGITRFPAASSCRGKASAAPDCDGVEPHNPSAPSPSQPLPSSRALELPGDHSEGFAGRWVGGKGSAPRSLP